MNQEIFREYDIRGVVGKDFDDAFALVLGKAFASYLRKNGAKGPMRVTVGYDARVSSPQLSRNLCEGLALSGVHVIDLGMITTPISYFSTYALPVQGAVMIT